MGLCLSASGAASAAIHYPTSVLSADQNGTSVKASRSDPTAALGPADGPDAGSFYSLGLGGDLTVGFGKTISGRSEITLTEVTWLPTSSYGEAVDVFAIFGGSETAIGTLTNGQSASGASLSYTGVFDSLRLVDSTGTLFPGSPSADGFDIDSIQLVVTAIPTPVAGGMLLTGVGILGLARSRRRTAD